jgi:UDP-N-acetylmuramoylalanine--D-glutamate ligase
LGDFTAVEHRLESVCKVNGIEFINDSKATNINSTWYALECQSTPVVWIVGGVDKGNDYTMVEELVRQKVKAIICLGVDNEKIHRAFEGIVSTIVDTNFGRGSGAYCLLPRHKRRHCFAVASLRQLRSF